MKKWLGFLAFILCIVWIQTIGHSMTSETLDITPRTDTPKTDTKSTTPDQKKNDDTADYSMVVKSLSNGKFVRMSDFKGKVIFLNFWATWCPPCRGEMPSIQKLYDKTKKDGLVFICISNESEGTVYKFIKENGYTFPIYTYSGYIPQVYEYTGIPTTFIISKDGKISI